MLYIYTGNWNKLDALTQFEVKEIANAHTVSFHLSKSARPVWPDVMRRYLASAHVQNERRSSWRWEAESCDLQFPHDFMTNVGEPIITTLALPKFKTAVAAVFLVSLSFQSEVFQRRCIDKQVTEFPRHNLEFGSSESIDLSIHFL